ncbi:hypothetical protein [Tardiphaga sp. 367_B4_N1_1]|uniref:hypothetical protein n=1 Tax=Tardiphaga sp. 367_B4_N1_1 TaxID=3240777 RepID=UPI003F25C8B1
MVFLKRYVAHDNEDCTFEIDEYRDDAGEPKLLAHLRVHKWTPKALKRIQRDWHTFRSTVTSPLYALPMLSPNDAGYSKWLRFVEMFGWRPTGQLVRCLDEIERPLFIHLQGP